MIPPLAASALLQAGLRRGMLSWDDALKWRSQLKNCGADVHMVKERLEAAHSLPPEQQSALLSLLPATEVVVDASFRPLACLGQGNIGTRWLGIPTKRELPELIVLWHLPAELCDAVSAGAFAGAIRALDASTARYLVPYHAIVPAPNSTWTIVHSYRPGQDVAARVQTKGPAHEARALDILRQAAKGLAHLHHHGCVHGALHPRRLLMNDEGVVALGSHLIGAQPLRTPWSPTQSDTVAFAAPECHEPTTRPTPASDFYALGCIGYWLLSGQVPFPGSPERQILQHCGTERPDVRLVAPQVSELTAKTLLKMMQIDPAHRYRDARSLVHSLERNRDQLTTGTEPNDNDADEQAAKSSFFLAEPE